MQGPSPLIRAMPKRKHFFREVFPPTIFILPFTKVVTGDPLYVAELCKWYSYGQTRSIGLVLFAKIVFYMHEEDHDQLNREKGMEQPQKEQFFLRPLCYFLSLA